MTIKQLANIILASFVAWVILITVVVFTMEAVKVERTTCRGDLGKRIECPE